MTVRTSLARAVPLAACFLLVALLAAGSSFAAVDTSAPAPGNGEAPGRKLARQAVKERQLWITSDHSKHEALKQSFTKPEEVTKACLGCHTEAAAQFHKTIHWTWLDPNSPASARMGKGGLVTNNFCINILSNEARCTSCHAGFGWKDQHFDFTDPAKVDCLVCHDQTGSYKKFPTKAGYPVTEPTKFGGAKMFYPPNYNEIAQNVGLPSRANCGGCHFNGGGGDGVKHGDLDTSLLKPSKQLDVHMGVDGQNFGCTRCHTTTVHSIAGRIYANPAAAERKSLLEDDLAPKIACESCHSATPHKAGHKANDHTDKVACQACHIPEFAREKPTKMSWDWSTAGKKKDGKPYVEEGPLGKHSYDSKKGDFRWEMNVVPEYYWFNGSMNTVRAVDKIDDGAEVKLSWPAGTKDDPRARIMPFKVHRGKTPYDKVNKTMAIPHLFGKDDAAFWKSYDWAEAIKAGMAYAGLDYSGEFGFVDTAWAYPTTHMVAPKDNVVPCSECHAKTGRVANLAGFYMPGRDSLAGLDWVGWLAVAGSFVGVFIHGLVRMRTRRDRGKED